MRDEKGGDDKILAVPIGEPRLESISTLRHLDPHWLIEIENFFRNYKELENKRTEVVGWDDEKAAVRIIAEARELYARSSNHPA